MSNYTEQALDLEAGIDDESSNLLKAFEKEIDAIDNVIAWANEKIAAANTPGRNVNSKELEEVEEKVVAVRGKLKAMAEKNKKFAREQSHRPATIRTRIVRYTKCTNDFIALTGSLGNAQEAHRRDLTAQVKRNVMDLNPQLNENAVDNAIGSGEQQQLERVLTASDTVAEIQQLEDVRARNKELQKLVNGVAQLNQIFQDMSLLVATQQDLINEVEYTQEEVIEDHKNANEQLAQAYNHQKSARRKKFWCIMLLVVIILIIVLSIILGLVLRPRPTV